MIVYRGRVLKGKKGGGVIKPILLNNRSSSVEAAAMLGQGEWRDNEWLIRLASINLTRYLGKA